MERTPPIAKQHARITIRPSTNPLLQLPVAILSSIILLNRAEFAILFINAIAGIPAMLCLAEVGNAANPEAARAVAELEGLKCIDGEASGKGRVDGLRTRRTEARW